MRKALFTTVLVLFFLAFYGCQSRQQIETSQKPAPEQVSGVPYSRGPNSPPSVKGPTGPVPGSAQAGAELKTGKSATVQAATQTESVRYTLEQTPTIKVKKGARVH